MKILVVEDDTTTRKLLAASLERASFTVTAVENGSCALEQIKRAVPDLILCDVAMPEVDGYALLKALRRDPMLVTIPFVFLTSDSDPRSRRVGMGLGADDFLTKPIAPMELVEAVKSRLERHEVLRGRLREISRNLASAVPHEFHTPLNTILGFSSIIQDTARSRERLAPEFLIEAAETIQESAHRLFGLTCKLTDFVELEHAYVNGNPTGPNRDSSLIDGPPTALVEVLDAAGRLPDAEIDFQPVVLGASERDFSRLCRELGENAAKFSPKGTPIRITGRTQENFYVIKVEDQGVGMTPTEIASIAPFRQFRRERIEQQGLGLGLAIVDGVARRCRGWVTLAPGPQSGLVAEVFLPLAVNGCEVADPLGELS